MRRSSHEVQIRLSTVTSYLLLMYVHFSHGLQTREVVKGRKAGSARRTLRSWVARLTV